MRARVSASLLLGLSFAFGCAHPGATLGSGAGPSAGATAGSAERSGGGAPGVADPDAGVPPDEASAAARAVDALGREAELFTSRLEEALWAQWTKGQGLDVAAVAERHARLFSTDTLATLRRARSLCAPETARAAAHLERFVAGELLSRALVPANAALAEVEANTTVQLQGREVPWLGLARALVAEPSALRRRGLWSAALEVLPALDAAIERRDGDGRRAAAELGLGSPLELALATREVDTEELTAAARLTLEATEREWRSAVERLAAESVQLPADKLTRADLPRLLRVPAADDAAFPAGDSAARGVALLGLLGLYGAPGLTLELSRSTTKNPLPVTVSPGGKSDTRVSFRPAGGLRDQRSLFAELGHAVTLHRAAAQRFELRRLGDPAFAHVAGELFASLLEEPDFLEAIGVPPPARASVARAARVERLFALRREAAAVLVSLQTNGASAAEARKRFVALTSEALLFPANEADGARWRVDGDFFLRSATALRAALYAEGLRARLRKELGDRWWRDGRAAGPLSAFWSQGTATSLERRLGPMGDAARLLGADLADRR